MREHLLGEAVDRGDRRRVEVRDRGLEPLGPDLALGAGELREDIVVERLGVAPAAPRAASVSRFRTRSRSSAAAARVNVTTRSSLTGDAFLGHVPHREGGERVGLARPRAGFDRDATGGEWPGELEAGALGHRAASTTAGVSAGPASDARESPSDGPAPDGSASRTWADPSTAVHR